MKARFGRLNEPVKANTPSTTPSSTSGWTISSTWREAVSVKATVLPCGEVSGMKTTPRSSDGLNSCGTLG